MHIDMHIDMRNDMCIDMHIDMCIGMCIDMCIDMCINMWIEMGETLRTLTSLFSRVMQLSSPDCKTNMSLPLSPTRNSTSAAKKKCWLARQQIAR